MRRWAQRISNDRLVFLDETAMKVNQAPSTTLVMPGESEYVVVEDDTSYAARYDMIGVVQVRRCYHLLFIVLKIERVEMLMVYVVGW